MEIIDKLAKRIVAHCEAVDPDDECEKHLNDTHDLIEIGAGNYLAGTVLREIDPTAFRSEVLTLMKSKEYVEVAGKHYRAEDVEKQIQAQTRTCRNCREYRKCAGPLRRMKIDPDDPTNEAIQICPRWRAVDGGSTPPKEN